MAVALELGPAAAQLRMLEVTSGLVARAGSAVSDDADESPLLSACATAADELRAHGAAVFQTFGTVCRTQLRLEPKTVLRAHLGPYVDQLALAEFKRAKPTSAAVREWRGLFETYWARCQAP